MTVDELVAALKGDAEGVTIVFGDGVTEYFYGVELVHVGPDHVLLTYKEDEAYYDTSSSHVLEPAE